MATVLPNDDVSARPSLGDWRVIDGRLCASFRTRSMTNGVELVRRVGEAAEELNHHPDIDLRYPRVHLMLVTHSAGGITDSDVALAERISALAAELDAPAEPARPTALAIAIDAMDIAAIVPFWRAVLGYRSAAGPAGESDDGALDLEDRDGRRPGVWFQQLDAPRPGRGRIHLDVHVPHDEAEARVAAAIDAGGHLVTDVYSPSWWVLADAEGNEVCICTGRERA